MKSRQRKDEGWIVLLAVLAMLAITIAFLGAAANNNTAKLERRDLTAAALAQAKAALLAYAISRDDEGGGSRPGEFPCPTLVAPGAIGYGVSANGCVTRRIGRLPWQTLGIPEIFDATGEPLWFALSTKFNPTVPIVNSSSRGDLTVYAANGVTALQTEVVAVIFSVGAPVANQNRSATASAPCLATSGTTISRNICADNYLDTVSGRNNATNAGPYVSSAANNSFNDSLIYITTSDFIPRIEERVAKAVARTAKAYYTQFGYFPYAAYYSDAATEPLRKNQANCNDLNFSGRFPEDISIFSSPPVSLQRCTGLKEWADVAVPNQLPTWYFVNRWNLSTYYAVGKAFAYGGSKVCGPLGDCLTVDADSNVRALIMLPGVPLVTQNRTSNSPPYNSNSLSDYFEVSENLEGWPTLVNYFFKADVTGLPSSDRVIAITN